MATHVCPEDPEDGRNTFFGKIGMLMYRTTWCQNKKHDPHFHLQ
jgi:hypothetical protein